MSVHLANTERAGAPICGATLAAGDTAGDDEARCDCAPCLWGAARLALAVMIRMLRRVEALPPPVVVMQPRRQK